MIAYTCQCGESYSVGSMQPDRCVGCEKCGTRLQLSGPPWLPPEPHEWATRYDDETGEPYQRCLACWARSPELPPAPSGEEAPDAG